MKSNFKISAVFPVEETELDLLGRKTLKNLRKYASRIEVIFVPKLTAATRAMRINYGVKSSTSPMFLLVHPRTEITEKGILSLLKISNQIVWGAFKHSFDISNIFFSFTSWYSNYVRGARGIYYLDHCLFCHRSIWIDIPDVPIFEDTLLCYNLRKIITPILLNERSVTSSIRFKKNGIFYQALLNQLIKIGFKAGISPKKLNCLYENQLNLN